MTLLARKEQSQNHSWTKEQTDQLETCDGLLVVSKNNTRIVKSKYCQNNTWTKEETDKQTDKLLSANKLSQASKQTSMRPVMVFLIRGLAESYNTSRPQKV